MLRPRLICAAGFEPATFAFQMRHSTKLSYAQMPETAQESGLISFSGSRVLRLARCLTIQVAVTPSHASRRL